MEQQTVCHIHHCGKRQRHKLTIGWTSAIALGAMILPTTSEQHTQMYNTNHVATTEETSNVYREFPSLFQGLGKVSGYTVTLPVTPGADITLNAPPRIPFHMRHKLDDEIKRLKDLD